MTRFAIFAATASLCATSAAAEIVKPTDVTFVDGVIEASLTGTPGDPAAGAEIMDKGAGNCIACHAVTELDHLGFHGEIGPPLDGAADRWSEAELRGIVADAKQMFDGTMMPSFYRVDGFIRLGDAYTGDAHQGEVEPLLTAQQIEDVVAYLMTLKDE
ncbi:sulfur oxidation c-type cytochrome SoxX [Roseobacter sinensis]|uniref:Sulfur oxidation c-type cytochrome SoxX n=1 Tax=Roseobacter sinensis TaxID=2931391 RepID=A0ABT3BI33_9RHOB|nr:sulfur oxidation c-type cytochrome SoxX [Roseobacter sp. WL0113]MCV3272774.1 sulfur oxidation c-type cytochrome SoxX [Roseobacter sp. WL0113]